MGGAVFSTSVLNNIASASVYRVTLMALVIGIVVLNILSALFYYINKITGNSSSLKPQRCGNLVLIFLLILLVVSWYFGCIESRNERLGLRQAKSPVASREVSVSSLDVLVDSQGEE